MSKVKVETSNKKVQTVIHCFPHILLAPDDLAKVSSSRGCQTAVSAAPDTTDSNFYTLLEFIPYQLIVEGALKEIDLPRRAFLQWKLPSFGSEKEEITSIASKTPERQESDFYRQKGVLKKSASNSTNLDLFIRGLTPHAITMQKEFADQGAQTILNVMPHVLNTDEVANVYTEVSIQTSITCFPNASMSHILPQLEANLPHGEVSSTQTELPSTDSIQPSEGSYIEIQLYSPNEDNIQNEQKVEEEITDSIHGDFKSLSSPTSDPKEKVFNTPPTTSVTLPSEKNKNVEHCQCHARVLNKIANKMRVQASTLKLTPKVFPPSTKFEDRMVQVLNTTIALLQTEMARLMEVYLDDEITASTPTPEPLSEQILQNLDLGTENQITNSSTISQNLDSNKTDPSYVKEDVVEQSTMKGFLEDNSETVIEETIRKAIFKEKLSDTHPFLTEATLDVAKESAVSCVCGPTSNPEDTTEDFTLTDEIGSMLEEAVLPEYLGEIKEEREENTPEQQNQISSSSSETAEAERAMALPVAETLGDYKENKRSSYIPCECHPTEAGAAPPTLSLDDSPSSLEAKVGTTPPAIVTPSPQTSVVNDTQSIEKSNKFELLMKKSVQDLESLSATSALVIHTTISYPDSSISKKENVKTSPSLPDLRDQVIRLSVIYKNGKTEPETKIEELLTPRRSVQITLNKSPSSRVTTKISNVSSAVSKSITQQNIAQSSSLYLRGDKKPLSNKSSAQSANLACECDKLSSILGSSHSSRLYQNPSDRPYESGRLPYVQRPLVVLSTVTFQNDYVPTKACNCVNKRDHSQQVNFSMPSPLCPTKPCSCGTKPSLSTAPPPPPLPSPPRPFVQPPNKSHACPYSYPSSYSNSLAPPAHIPVFTYPEGNITNDGDVEITIAVSLGANDDSEENATQTLSLTYEDDAVYEEPYMATLAEDDTSTAVQTDLALGEKLESDSLSSLCKEDQDLPTECNSKTEMPWGAISLPPPGSYSIKSAIETQNETIETTETSADKTEDGAVKENEKEEPPPAEPEPHNAKPRKKREKLLFEEVLKHNEPYMEGLYKDFPNSDDEEENCDSNTEMPWKDILLPQNCKIKKIRKTKMCMCRSNVQTVSGMFLPHNTSTKRLDDNEEGDVIEIHMGIDEPGSNIIPVEQGQSDFGSKVSEYSNIAQRAKRCPKDYVLRVNLEKDSNYSISFQTGQGNLQRVAMDQTPSSSSQPYQITTKQVMEGKTSSLIVSIKPSTECPYQSQKIAISTDKTLITPSNLPMYVGSIPAGTQSFTTSHTSKMGCQSKPNVYPAKRSHSMPAVCSQKSIRATVSLKRLGEPDKTVSREMALNPGDNFMTLKLPNEPISLKMKLSTPNTQICNAGPSCMTNSTKQEEVFVPARCICKDNVKPDTFKEDPVMAALDAYEAEMKPLRQALTELQQKIRNLNMPEMKGCLCATALQNPAPPTLSQSNLFNSSGTVPTTSSYFKPQIQSTFGYSYNIPNACPYFQPASFRPKYLPYGCLPPPVLPPYRQNYGPPPSYSSSKTACPQSCYCSRARGIPNESIYSTCRQSDQVRSKGSNRHNKGYVPIRPRDYPKEDLSLQARCYGMYPDYRGRTYPDEQIAYQDSFGESHNRGDKQKYKIRHVISVHSSGDVSDYDGYDSQGTSDIDAPCCRAPSKYNRTVGRSSSQRRRAKPSYSKSSSRSDTFETCTPCRDNLEGQVLRSGQAVKTDPDDFLLSTCVMNKRSQGTSSTFPKVISRNKIHIKVPSR